MYVDKCIGGFLANTVIQLRLEETNSHGKCVPSVA